MKFTTASSRKTGNREAHMELVVAFQILKERVLSTYCEKYPYVAADWKTFSSKDIDQLIDEIEQKTRQKVSERWIYTHLKSDKTDKLPRKDMLNILAQYCSYDSWEDFIHNVEESSTLNPTKPHQNQKNKKIIFGVSIALIITFFTLYLYRIKNSKHEFKTKKEAIIPVKDLYTQENIKDTTVRLFVKEGKVLKPLNIHKIPDSIITNQSEVVVKSPFYTEASIDKNEKTIVLKPDDYAMMLKAFMKSDIKDWEIRKEQLNKILSDNLEVLIHLQNNLGIEYMNKTEFAQKLIIPTKAIKKWEIISLEEDDNQQITKIRIITK